MIFRKVALMPLCVTPIVPEMDAYSFVGRISQVIPDHAGVPAEHAT